MIRFTDAVHTLIVEGIDLTSSNRVYVTYAQIFPDDVQSNSHNLETMKKNDIIKVTINDPIISKSNNDSVVSVNLSQLQTGSFEPGQVRVQVNWIDSLNKRHATDVEIIDVPDNLMDAVV